MVHQINIGDYILGTEEIWEVIAIHNIGMDTVYDIQPITQPADFLEVFDYTTNEYIPAKVSKTLNRVSRGYLRHLGEIVPKDSEKAIKTLFGD
jgi:hypothetical protein